MTPRPGELMAAPYAGAGLTKEGGHTLTDQVYVKKERLKELVEEAQATGQASEELCEVVRKIAAGTARRFRFKCDVADFEADCVLLILTKPRRIDTTLNVFSW